MALLVVLHALDLPDLQRDHVDLGPRRLQRFDRLFQFRLFKTVRRQDRDLSPFQPLIRHQNLRSMD
jgi:hypothetical protein